MIRKDTWLVVVFTHPIDYIKTKKQIYTQNKMSIGFIKYISRNSFYSGVIPRMTGVVPMRFVFWGFKIVVIITPKIL